MRKSAISKTNALSINNLTFPKSITLDSTNGDLDEKIKVFVRVRPLKRNEIGKEQVTFSDPTTNVLKVSDHSRYFESTFNKVFNERSSQRDVFNSIQYCLDSVLSGFNSTIFAYG